MADIRPLVNSDEQATLTLAEWKTRVGLPARLSLSDPRTHDGTVKVPGTIRGVTPMGVTVDLFFPLLSPRLGAPVMLEVMSKTALLQCTTTIQNSSSPQCVHLALPGEIHSIERRQSLRVNVTVSATVRSAETNSVCEATVTNISIGGCAAVLAAPLATGAVAHLDLRSAGLEPAHVDAQVVRCSLSAIHPGRWEVGLSFYNLTEEQNNQLTGYLKLYA